MRRLTLAWCLLAIVTAVPQAQQALPNTDRPKFGTSTAAVVVDVIVRDKKGNPVVDLSKDDFEVFENGTVQKLIDFERVLPGTAAPQVAGSPPVAPAPVVEGEAAGDGFSLQGQAVTAIVFELTFFLPMLVDSGEPVPSTRMELLSGGRSLGTIDVPPAKADHDSLRQVGQLPIDKLPPGVYELRATITAGDRRMARTAVFTLVP